MASYTTSTSETTNAISSHEEEYPPISSFDELRISENLLRGIYSSGWDKPSPIQQKAIVPILNGRDLQAQAKSGTGKTGTFTIGILGILDYTLLSTQAIILVPTRELATQIYDVITNVGKKVGVRVCCAVGGNPRHKNVEEIRSGVHVVVGTPGRIFDLAHHGILRFDWLKIFVLDEADDLLTDTFQEQVRAIFGIGLPGTCKVALFSATFPDEVNKLACSILRDPVRITIKSEEVSVKAINQYYVPVDDFREKFIVIQDLFQALSITSSIIFCNSREDAVSLHQKMTDNGFPVSVIFGEMPQADREKRMKQFRDGQTRVLISTNVLARGIDVQQLSIVFNYQLPPEDDPESYIHRIGRCGRFGRKGVSISLVTPDEKDVLDKIASTFGFEISELPDKPDEITKGL